MNDPELELEVELRGLRPLAPPPRLRTDLERVLRAASPGPALPRATLRRSLWASWCLTAAAAAAACVAWWPSPARTGAVVTPEAAIVPGKLVPIATSNVLTDARDEGLVLLPDGQPARRVRYHFVDTVQLRDTRDQAALAVSRPREEVRFVPVNLY